MIEGNKKRPDVYGIGWTTTALKCKGCGRVILVNSPVKMRVSYNYYYDHCDFYHLFCLMPKEMFVKPTEAM